MVYLYLVVTVVRPLLLEYGKEAVGENVRVILIDCLHLVEESDHPVLSGKGGLR